MTGGIVFPLPAGSFWISAPYGERRPSGVHRGTDLAAPSGTAVHAPISGRIDIPAPEPNGAGVNVWVTSSSGRRWKVFHLSTVLARHGQAVTAGQLIGRVGSTGRSSGPHAHVELWAAEGGWHVVDCHPALLEAIRANRFPGPAVAVSGATMTTNDDEELSMADVERILAKLDQLGTADLTLAVRIYQRLDETHAESGRWMADLAANVTALVRTAVVEAVGQVAGDGVDLVAVGAAVERAVANALGSLAEAGLRATFDPVPTQIPPPAPVA